MLGPAGAACRVGRVGRRRRPAGCERGAHASAVGVCVCVCVCDAGVSREAFTGSSCTWGGPLLCDRGQGHGACSCRDPSAMRVAEAQGGATRRDIEPLSGLCWVAAACVCVCASVCCVWSVCGVRFECIAVRAYSRVAVYRRGKCRWRLVGRWSERGATRQDINQQRHARHTHSEQ